MTGASPLHHDSRQHGATDAMGAPPWDFSTNSNAAGPCPHTQAALVATNACRYPDPAYTNLCAELACLHQVTANRIVIGASGSELIMRLTCWKSLDTTGQGKIWCAPHAYSDYRHAGCQYGLHACSQIIDADLVWLCAPSSPEGQSLILPENWQQHSPDATIALDCAYAPLQLANDKSVPPELDLDNVWQIWTPNKALGFCGIRAAYAIAPESSHTQQLAALAPSWPIGAHGVALLHSWCSSDTQMWLQQARQILMQWKYSQIALLHQLGWRCLPSETNFFVAQPYLPARMDIATLLKQLRQHGIKLRDCTSFGLPDMLRLCVHTPQAQQALRQSLAEIYSCN